MRHQTAGSSALKSHERFTYAELRQWPEDERWELFDGQAYSMSPAPRRKHQVLAFRLGRQLGDYFDGKPCRPHIAPVDVFWLDDATVELDAAETVTQPDLFVVCDHAKLIDEGIKGAPDFIIEILSPATAWRDQNEKRQLHERFGVREYWIINPENLEVLIYTLVDGRYGLPRVASLRGPVPVGLFAGLELSVDEDSLA